MIHRKGGAEVFALYGRPLVVGRGSDSDIVLADPKASRLHLRIEPDGETYRVVDVGSQNGTYRNGRRIRTATLCAGDVLVVGTTRIVFEDDGPPADDLPQTAPGSPLGLETVVGLEAPPSGLRRLAEIGHAINAETRSATLFARIIDAAVELTRAERGFLIESRKQGMEFAAARNLAKEDLSKPEFELSWSIAIQVGTRGEGVLTVNAALDPRFAAKESVESLGLRSVLCVPVKGPNGILGVIYVDHRLRDGLFTQDELDLLEVLAGFAGIALTNRRLLDDLEQRSTEVLDLNRRLAAELATRSDELHEARAALDSRDGEPPPDARSLIGGSARMDELRHLLRKVAATDFPVLVFGESGTGKELVARAIHSGSSRARRPFVSVNCAAMPESLLESELFGHTKGAFTGADSAKQGLFQAADSGTIFLDEVSETSPAMQTRLLRVLQEGEVRPVGGKEALQVDVRVVAASNRDLADLVRKGLFREDLFYRLRVLPVTLPPLRERRSDIPELIAYFFKRHATRPAPAIEPGALDILCSYAWPGNVRELENEVKRLCVLAGQKVDIGSLSRNIVEAGEMLVGKDSGFEDLNVLVESIETREIRKALDRARGNKTRAAELLGITRFTLQRKLDKYGLQADENT